MNCQRGVILGHFSLVNMTRYRYKAYPSYLKRCPGSVIQLVSLFGPWALRLQPLWYISMRKFGIPEWELAGPEEGASSHARYILDIGTSSNALLPKC